MLRRLPPIIQFIFFSMIGICLGSMVGLGYEFLERPFSATNAVVWLFITIVSGGIVTLIYLYGRNRLG
ncbi:hypothetical protein ACFSUS_05385 [Spirosoma soli]|uniref:AtpZ/AtpI family protein n=1 Tax=Spirosoma soli TaxID=1770529 RepID=A0ABW5LZ83_9BACT